jgi:hypothetical protein
MSPGDPFVIRTDLPEGSGFRLFSSVAPQLVADGDWADGARSGYRRSSVILARNG